MTDSAARSRTGDSALLDELRTHVADHTPSCNARTDYLLRRAVDELARLAEQPQRLLARLEADRAKTIRNASLCRTEEVRWVNEGMAAAHRADCGHLLAVFESPEAAAEYIRQSGPHASLAIPDTTSVDGLREQYAAAIRALNDGGTLADLDEEDDVYRLADTVLAVRDREMEQLTARVAELEQQVAEDADDYHALADHTDTTCEAVQRRDAAEAAVERVRDLAADMRTWCSPRGIATDYADRIDEALAGPASERPAEEAE